MSTSTLLLILLISTFDIDHACGTCVTDCDWSVGEWGECSRSCGGGYQTRNRTRCCHDNESAEACQERCQRKSVGDVPETNRTCNSFCFNGGKFGETTGQCRCRQGWTGTCCKEVSNAYTYNCSPHAVHGADVNFFTNSSQFTIGSSKETMQNVSYVVRTYLANEMADVSVARDMPVGITFFTDTNHASGGNMRHMAASFSSLLKGTLIYRGQFFGNITKISLQVTRRDNHFEIPEAMDVIPTSLTHPSVFHCMRTLSEMQHLQRLVRKRRSLSRNLRIEIRTSSAWFAGTGAKVYVRLMGDKGTTRDMRMTGGFGRGDVAKNTVNIKEIGVIKKLRIWHDNSGSRAGWDLDWVRVYELSESGVKYEFHCGCSLEGSNNAKERTHSTGCSSIPNCRTQRCHTCVECDTPPAKHFYKLSSDKHTCQLCPYLENCLKQECHECTRCIIPPATANYIYRMQKDKQKCYRSCVDMNGDVRHSLLWLSPDKEHCDATCSYVKDRWCWPGTCSDGLTTSCACDAGFRRNGSAMCDVDTKADLITCNVGIEDPRGVMKNSTSIGNKTDCYSKTDVYVNIQPAYMSFSITANLQNKATSHQPVYISGTYIGIVDSNLTVTRMTLSGAEYTLSSTTLRGGGDCSKDLSSSAPSPLVSCDRVLNGSTSLLNGEWLCGVIKVYSGGSFDYKDFAGHSLGNKKFTPLDESKTICFRYDNVAPGHCTTDSRFPCSSDSPMRLSSRATKSPNITVAVSGWVDPHPKFGQQEQASGIKYYKVDVYGMKHLGPNTLDVDYANHVFKSDQLSGISVNITVSLPSEPAMYVTYVEVHDVAGNVRFVRRILLYDKSSKLEVRTTRALRVISASKDTRYTWQIHHGDIQLDWKERYHNGYYITNNYFCQVKPDTDNAITGVYDQVSGILPVTGTVSIHGITSFKYQWSLNNGSKTSWESVPDFTNQSLSLGLNLTDGETYEVWIKAQDIMMNTIVESVVVHIDRTVPDIADAWLVRDGTSQVYVHNNTDLSTMVLQFRAWDVHSGIGSVLWALGTTDAASDLGNGALPVRKLDALGRCPRGPDCYCPSVGPCEFQNYTLDLGRTTLKANNTNTGQHNREYYFTLFITNGAMLKSFAHLDVLTDESPPVVGIVQEGSIDGPDIDYTSEGHVLISWRGFIDHESGIRYYIVGLADRCLSVDELQQTSTIHAIIQKATTESLSVGFPKEGRYFTSLLAVNNALEPSDVICSDGITFDLSPPIIENITLHQASSLSSLQCIIDQPWLINSNMTMARLPMVQMCQERCHNNPDMSLRFPIVYGSYIDNETAHSLCRDLPYLNETLIYVPFHKIVLNWSLTEDESQIRDSFIGFGYDASTYNKPDLANYKPTHRKTSYHSHETGFDSRTEFYIFIKTENKAGISSVATLGPVMIDDTSPDVHGTLVPDIVGDHIRITWTNKTFSDPEEVHQQFTVTYRAVMDEDYVTPILQTPSGASEICKAEGHAGCIQYPMVLLQRQDSELGKRCLFELYVYNSAGHFTTVRTESIRLPSLFPPGPALVVDVDPSDVNSLTDVDFHQHFSACAHWSGFKHHRNVTFEIGIGSAAGIDDVAAFAGVAGTDVHTACINSSSLSTFVKYFTSVRAKCSGGETVSSSDGFMIVSDVSHSISVYDGLSCKLNDEMLVNILDLHNLSHSMSVNVTFENPLHLGHRYSTVIRNITTFEGFSFRSDDVFTTGSNIVDNSTYHVEFFPLTTNPDFQLRFATGSSFNIEVYRCVKDVDYQVSTTSYTLHWECISEYTDFATSYHLQLLERTCYNESLEPCVKIIRETTVKTGGDTVHFLKNLNLQIGHRYLSSVSPCYGHTCVKGELSNGVVVSKVPEIGNVVSVIQDDTGDCTNISVEVESIDCGETLNISVSCIVQWAIVKSESDISPVTTWIQVNSGSCNVKTSACLKLPIHSYQKLFTCVRVFCPSGQFASKCADLTLNPYATSYSEHALFELPADDKRLTNIEDILHSERLGRKLKLLHELDVDFIDSNSRVSSVITNTAGCNVTWFIMRGIQQVPVYDCDSDIFCLTWKFTQTGFVRFGWIDFDDSESYYICASVSENAEKELMSFTICGNGFVVDKTPPVGGSVSVANAVSGYITDPSRMVITWSGFSDKQPHGVAYAHAIKSYSVAIGNYPHGQNVLAWTKIGDRTSFQAEGLSIKTGEVYYATIKAEDHVGHVTESISPEVVGDLTPPVCGEIQIEGLYPHKKVLRTKTLRIHWKDIHDLESGIESYHLSIFTSVNTQAPSLFFGAETEKNLQIDGRFIEGLVYEIRIQATNNAQLRSLCISRPFTIDNSKPYPGIVRDGFVGIEDEVDYQTSTTEIGCHWTGFHDPHSGIQSYRIGLGTSPGVWDVKPLVSVGLRTNHNWTHAFIPGVKYYSTVETCNNVGLCVTASSNGVIMDGSAPAAGVVIVGHADTHNKYHGHRSYVHSKWVGFEDAETGIHHFECCIGQRSGWCDIMNFTNTALSDSYLANGLHLPLSVPLFVTVRAYNPVGLFAEAVSPSFKVDDTAPEVIDRPVFISTSPDGPENITIQWDNSVLYLRWKFADNGSPIHEHILSFKTHHESAVAVEQITLGPQNSHLLILPKERRLRNGDKYQLSVTSCNRAGLCTTSHSKNIVIDSTPPIVGGFKPPLMWQTVSVNGSEVTFVNLTWYGFSDAESNISCYHLNVGTSYEGGELTNGTVTVNHDPSVKEQSTTIQLTHTLGGGEIILSIWAENNAHLLSHVGKVTVSVVATDHKRRRGGTLELQRHSCDTHYCTDDCTCAVIGRKCNPPATPVACRDLSNITSHKLADVQIYPIARNQSGLYITSSLSCIAGYWETDTTYDIQRYEWSMGLLNEPFGAGIFKTNEESIWYDVGKRTEIVHCMPYGRALEHGDDYVIYIRAWYSESEFRVFTSPSIRVDHTPPSVRRGRALKDSDSTCSRDFDVFDSNQTDITACWQGLFQETQTYIEEYIIWAGVTKYGSDLLPYQSAGLTTNISLPVVNVTHGTKYYVGIRAINSLNMSATVISDGFVVDADNPVGGNVFNTEHHRSRQTQSDNSCFGVSWHGFQDHHSSVKQYHVYLREDNSSHTVTNTTVTLRNSVLFDDLNLEHGQYYSVSVVAEDFAGHLSDEVTSLPVLVDATPPYGFVCKNFTNISTSNLTYEETDVGSGSLNVLKVELPRDAGSHFRVKVCIQRDHLDYEEALFAVGGIHIQIPFVLKYNHTLHCAEYQFTLEAETLSVSALLEVTIQSKESFQDADIEVEECSDRQRTDGSEAITARQLAPSLLGICTRMMDPESGLMNVQIGVGTTPGGFQLQRLHHAEAGFHQLVEVTVPHGTPVYTTVIAENGAGLRTHYLSEPIVLDHTPPTISDVNAALIYSGSKPSPIVRASGSWLADDDESGIATCWCALGRVRLSSDLHNWVTSESGTSCQITVPHPSHGIRLYMTIQCTNNVELDTVVSSNELQILFRPPSAGGSVVDFVVQNRYSQHGKNVPQSIMSSLAFQWTWPDQDTVSHYQCRVTDIMVWMNTTLRYCEMSGVRLKDGEGYTAEVRAVNMRQEVSEAVSASVTVDSTAPLLTGRKALVQWRPKSVRVFYGEVFYPRRDYLTYTISVGSNKGYSDYMHLYTTRHNDVTVNVPGTTSEVHVTITAQAPVGTCDTYSGSFTRS